MNIVMITNTYKPHVGGVAVSVDTFTQAYRKRGHRVLVIAPEYENASENEADVIRFPAIQNFNGSDFSVVYPIPMFLTHELNDFKPDIIHSHHPFMLGDTALRIAALRGIPLVFTHHTLYECYTHYVPGDSPAMRRFVIELSTGYANLCNQVIAPSESIAEVITQRGVESPVSVIPTGIDIHRFAKGYGRSFRAKMKIPSSALVVGFTSRLASEKNLQFLCKAVARFLSGRPKARFLVVGSGPGREDMESIFAEAGLLGRVCFAGPQTGQDLVDSYHAMDIFAFASHTETQGLVLAEAAASGVPVVALDASGSREVVCDGFNGRLLMHEDAEEFADALELIASCSPEQMRSMRRDAQISSIPFSVDNCVDKVLDLYKRLLSTNPGAMPSESETLPTVLRMIEEEWNLWANRFSAVAEAALGDSSE